MIGIFLVIGGIICLVIYGFNSKSNLNYKCLIDAEKERDSIKAKADKLAWWVDNYISGEKKTDYGDLCEALSEYKGGENGH